MNNVETLTRGDVQYTTGGTGIAHSEYNNHPDKEVHFLQIWYPPHLSPNSPPSPIHITSFLPFCFLSILLRVCLRQFANNRVKPGKNGLKPTYYTRHHPSETKRDTLVPIISPITTLSSTTFPKEGTNEPIPIHQDMRFYATILSPGKQVEYTFQGEGDRLGYVHLAQMSGYNPAKETSGAKVDVGKQEIREGDGVFVRGAKKGDTVSFKNTGEIDAELVWFEMGEKGSEL